MHHFGTLAHSYGPQHDPNHPSLLWALLAVVIVGSNPLAGVIALTFYSVGYLAKFFSETFEAANTDAQKALRSLGASPLQAFQYGLGLMQDPLYGAIAYGCSNTMCARLVLLDMWAGGIGLHLKLYAESADSWNKFSSYFLYPFNYYNLGLCRGKNSKIHPR